MAAVARGEKADRIPFMPTVFEHSAALIGKTPSETATDRKLLEEAQVRAYETYGHDVVTVGIDVYNIEAEALGCCIRYHEDNSIPGVSSHPLEESLDASGIVFSPGKGRISLILDAAEAVSCRIGNEVAVGVGICGPFSVAVELAGYGRIIMECLDGGKRAHRLLERVLEFQREYCREIAARGLGITVFESWATPPLLSPEVYREFVATYERELINYIKKDLRMASAPLVIGGDTTPIVDDIIGTGTTLLVADYKVDPRAYARKARENNLMLRCNIDPKLVEKGPASDILAAAEKLVAAADGYEKFVLGTGVIPYGTPPENLLAIKRFLVSIADKYQ